MEEASENVDFAMNGSFFSQVPAAQVDQSLHSGAPQPNPERGGPLLQEGFDALTDHKLRFLDDVRRIEPRPQVVLHVCLNQSVANSHDGD